MFGKKEKYDFDKYISALSCFAEYAYKSSEIDVARLQIEESDSLLRALDYTRLYLISDLASAWLNFDAETTKIFERKLFAKFYQKYPEDFLTELHFSVKSNETLFGDITDFIATNFSNDTFEKLSIAAYVTADFKASLEMFASIFRATKIKNDLFIIDFKKLRKK